MRSRRKLLREIGHTALAFAGLANLATGVTEARDPAPRFGPLVPDPEGVFDLPRRFSYRVVSRVGQAMLQGLHVPGSMDGMAAFPGPRGTTLLVRNHELEPKASHQRWSPFQDPKRPLGALPADVFYDVRDRKHPDIGGTTTVVYDTRRGRTIREFLSLIGTRRNCAGGITPWGTWLSCEETTALVAGSKKAHGYAFEVTPTPRPSLTPPVALEAMGRFRREATAVDRASGAIYQTEDLGDGLFYRFLPTKRGDLAKGGTLQALRIRGHPKIDTTAAFKPGATFDVDWVPLRDVKSPNDDLRVQGLELGAARFNRGEGIWMAKRHLYFCATRGGRKTEGQIWQYTPSPVEGTPAEVQQPGALTLFLQPDDARVLENADNLTVAPWGDLLVCEDHGSPRRVPANRLQGVTPKGQVYPFGRNVLDGGRSELAGVCFSPDRSTLFVNIQFPGITLAVTGPWPRA